MLVDVGILKEYEALVRSRNWNDLYYLFENDRTDIREDQSMKRIITLETVPLYVYMSFMVPQRDRRDHRKVFSAFDDEFMVEVAGDFLMSSNSLTNYFGTCYIQELMERGENMNEVIIKVLENNSFLRSRRPIALKAVKVSREGTNNILYHLIRIRMAKEIERKGVSLDRCAHLRMWPSLISQVDSKDVKICFREFFKLLKDSYPSLLERPDIVNSMGLVDSAIHYGKEDALRYLFTRCHGLLLNNSASIFRSIAEIKCSVSLALALGIGASVQDLKHYPTNVKVLLDVDRRGLCPLHFLWMMPSAQRRLKIDTNRYSRDKSMETVFVERTLMCIRVCAQKFPDSLHHFGRAWKHVSSNSKPISGRYKQSCPVQQPYSLGMMKRIIHEIALTQGRKPLHVACEYGFSWDKGIRVFYNEDESLIYTADPLTNLKPFALAACSDESDLDSIYELLVRHPDAIGV
jgi:hypothetical protein